MSQEAALAALQLVSEERKGETERERGAGRDSTLEEIPHGRHTFLLQT